MPSSERSATATEGVIAHLPVRREDVPDDELVRRATRGDRWAEAEIYRRHARIVANVAGRIVRHRQDAADVVQDTFVVALERLGTLRDPGALRGWLLRIAVHQANRRFRRRRLLARLGFVDGFEEHATAWQPAWNTPPDVQAQLSVLEQTLLELPARQRNAWILHHIEGETLPVAATACAVSLATVKRDIAAAHAFVRARLGAQEP